MTRRRTGCWLVGLGLLLLLACDRNGKPPPIIDPHIGPDGIALTSRDGPELDPVYADSEIDLALELENKGAHDLADVAGQQYAHLYVTYDPRYLLFDPDRFVGPDGAVIAHSPSQPGELTVSQVLLRGKSLDVPQGDREVAFFPFDVPDLSGQQGVVTTQVIFTACYPYQTDFAKDICMDADTYAVDARKKVCQSTERDFTNQGAPVAVTHIEPRIGREEGFLLPLFVITLQNVGSGLLFSYDPAATPRRPVPEICAQDSAQNPACDLVCRLDPARCATCRQQEDSTYGFNRALVSASLSGVPLDCGAGEAPIMVKFIENQAKVRCRARPEDKDAFPMQATNYLAGLEITVQYAYKSSVVKHLRIART